jgi:hypothetical protein
MAEVTLLILPENSKYAHGGTGLHLPKLILIIAGNVVHPLICRVCRLIFFMAISKFSFEYE